MKASKHVLLAVALLFITGVVLAQDTGDSDAAETDASSTTAQQDTSGNDQPDATAEEADGAREEMPAEPDDPVDDIMSDPGAPEVEAETAQPEAMPDSVEELPGDPVADAPAVTPPGQQQTFTLQVHPTFPPDQAERVYRPLINYLNFTTPYQFQLRSARDFHRYWVEIRRGVMPDLVIEDAHLIALRMERHGYQPLVKAAEDTSFSLMTSGNPEAELSNFLGRPISSMPAPSLGYLILSSWFENPMQQPLIESNAASWRDAVEIVFSMEADAAIVPQNLVERYVNLEVVRTSESFPNVTVAASPDIPEAAREDIRRSLLVLHDDREYFSALHELDIDQFVAAEPEDYEGLTSWLEQVFSFL